MRKFFSVLIPISFLCAAVFVVTPAGAHGGGVSPKDQCHKSKADGNRHKHFAGTTEIEFICEKDDITGATLYTSPEPDTEELKAMVAELRASLEQTLEREAHAKALNNREIDNLEREIANVKSSARDAIAKAVAEGEALTRQYEQRVIAIRQDERVAATARQEAEAEAEAIMAQTNHLAEQILGTANTLLAEAKAREAGAGPPANRACTNALKRLVLDADTAWLSSKVKVDEKDRAELRLACLGSQ